MGVEHNCHGPRYDKEAACHVPNGFEGSAKQQEPATRFRQGVLSGSRPWDHSLALNQRSSVRHYNNREESHSKKRDKR